MYEKTLLHRGLVIVAASIAILLLSLFDQANFMSYILHLVPDTFLGYTVHALIFVVVYGTAFLPGWYFLRRERIPNSSIIPVFAAFGGLIVTWPMSALLFPLVGYKDMFISVSFAILVFYLIGYEVLTGLDHKKGWFVARVVLLVGVALNALWVLYGLRHNL